MHSFSRILAIMVTLEKLDMGAYIAFTRHVTYASLIKHIGLGGWIMTNKIKSFFVKCKKRTWPIPSDLDSPKPWSIKDSLYGQDKIFSFRKKQAISSRQDWLILPAQVANQNTGFTSSLLLPEPTM